MEAWIYAHPHGKTAEGSVLRTPMTGRSVWPEQRCPVFSARTVGLSCGSVCWFCRYANFHLREQMALEVGICCWPELQTD